MTCLINTFIKYNPTILLKSINNPQLLTQKIPLEDFLLDQDPYSTSSLVSFG